MDVIESQFWMFEQMNTACSELVKPEGRNICSTLEEPSLQWLQKMNSKGLWTLTLENLIKK